MAKVKRTLTVEVDTDTFTKEEWKVFIKENVPTRLIIETIRTDLFVYERLKALAIANATRSQAAWDEFFE